MYKTTQNFNIIVLNLIVRILQLSLFHSYGHQISVVYETGHSCTEKCQAIMTQFRVVERSYKVSY